MAGWWSRDSAERHDFTMKIDNLFVLGALKPEASRPSQSLWALGMHTCVGALLVCASVAACPFLFLCSFTGGAFVEVCLCLLVIPDFFIDLLLKPASSSREKL